MTVYRTPKGAAEKVDATECREGDGSMNRPRNPALQRIWDRFATLSTAGEPPTLSPFPVDFFRDHLAHMEVIGVEAGGADFSYRLLGTWFPVISRGDYTGKRVTEIDGHGPGSRLFSLYTKAAAEGRPTVERLRYIGPLSFVSGVEAILLPYSSDGSAIDRIAGAIALERKDRVPPEFRIPTWVPEIPEAGLSLR